MIEEVHSKKTDLDGVTLIEAPGWDGRILRMSHRTFVDSKAGQEIVQRVGVYMLYADHFDRGVHGNELYIGQTGVLTQRLRQHVESKKYWSAVLVFSSRNDWMNVAYTPNIERQFIKWAKDAGRYNVMNGNEGRTEHLGVEDRKRLKDFLAGVRPVLHLAGIDVFEVNLDGLFQSASINRGILSYMSNIKISQLTPIPKITIVAGSEMNLSSEDRTFAQNLPGVTSLKFGCRFGQDIELDVDTSGTIPRIFKRTNLTKWTNSCGIPLSDVIKKSLEQP